MNKAGERLINGLAKENPTFVLMLGMCPTLAVTTSAMNGLGMGLTTMVVLALSNLMISLLRKIIPNRVRIPAFIVIIASFVTAVQLLLEGYLPTLNKSLGVYIPLIVVNCIILGRAESYAYSNPPIPSLFDGIGMGLGFTVALTCIGAVRELLGAGELFGASVMPASFVPIRIFGQAPGAFFVLAALVAIQNLVKESLKKRGKPYEKIGSGCSEDCMNCSDMGCTRRFYDNTGEDKAPEAISTDNDAVTDTNATEKRKNSKKKSKSHVNDKTVGSDERSDGSTVSEENSSIVRDKSAEEQKLEEQKPEEQKPEEQKPEEQKLEEQKPEEQKLEEQKPEEQKPEEQKLEEQKPEEQKPEEQKSEEQDREGQTENRKATGGNKVSSNRKKSQKKNKEKESSSTKKDTDDTKGTPDAAEETRKFIPIEEDEDLEILDLEGEE